VKLVAEVKWREEMEWEEIERTGKILSRFPKNVRKSSFFSVFLEAIAAQKWCDSGKETTAYAYDLFAK